LFALTILSSFCEIINSDRAPEDYAIENIAHDTLRRNTQDNIAGVLDNITNFLGSFWKDNQYKASTVVKSRFKKLNGYQQAQSEKY